MIAKDTLDRPPSEPSAIPANPKLDAYVDGIKHLPPTPSLMVKLLAIFRQPDPDIDEVVSLISRDPSLTAEVLKRCNSVHFGGEKSVTDIFEAISRLGFYEVYRVVVVISGSRTMALESVASVVWVESLWRHSLATALAAGRVAKAAGESEASAFTAGLLHDVGKIVLASAEGAKYTALTRKVGAQKSSHSVEEKMLFSFDHSEVGAHLLERWCLSAEVVTAVRYHHDLAGAGQAARLAATVAFANKIAKSALNYAASEADTLANVEEEAAILHLAPNDVSVILAQAQKDLEKDTAKLMGQGAKKTAR